MCVCEGLESPAASADSSRRVDAGGNAEGIFIENTTHKTRMPLPLRPCRSEETRELRDTHRRELTACVCVCVSETCKHVKTLSADVRRQEKLLVCHRDSKSEQSRQE